MAPAAGTAIVGLRVRVLGPFEIDGLDVSTVASRKGRQLLRLLALGRGAPVSVDRLVDALWGDSPPAKPNDQVSVLVSRLRGVLGTEVITRSDAGYALHVGWLDLDEFESLVDDAEQRMATGSAAAARAAADAALRLARGPLLADEVDVPWVDEERSAVARRVGRVTVVAAEAELDGGQPAAAALLAERALDADPYDEVALRLLMRAHERAGRPASALAAYARARERLRDDLGVSLTPETESLHDALLSGPAVSPTPSVSPPGPVEPVELPVLEHSPLAGRASALATLEEQLEGALGGAARFVVVEGESGIGKSTLLDVWCAAAVAAQLPVLRGRCDEVSRQLPLQAVLDALDSHLAGLEPAAADALLGAEAGLLRPLLATSRSPSSAVAGDDARRDLGALAGSGTDQAMLFTALVAVIDRIMGRRGGVLVLDDLHFAGVSTADWLRFLQRRTRGRLLVVVATRPEGKPVLHPDVTVVLGPLDLRAAVEVVGDEARASSLLERSGGHPLLLVELAHATDPEHDNAVPATDDTDGVDGGVPASIGRAVSDRLRQMGERAGATVSTAAVLGEEVDLDLLAEVLGRSPIEVLDDVEQGVAHRFLDEAGAALTFRHALVRDALVAGMTTARRSLLHREAARALARRPAADPFEVARHARLGGEYELAATSLGEAAARASRRHDRAEAVRLLDDAIGLCDLPVLRLSRGIEHLAAGDYAAASADAMATLGADVDARALELLGWARYYLRQFDDAQRAADQGARLADDPAVEASCLVLAGRVLQANGELGRADERMTQAESLVDAARMPVVPVWIGSLRTQQGRNTEAVDLAERGLLQPGAIDHPFAVIHAHFTLAHAEAQLGHVDRALAALDAADHEITEHVIDRYAARAENWRAWIVRYLGAFAEADERNDRAFTAAVPLGLDEPLAHALLDQADGALLVGDLDRAAARLEQASPYHERPHVMRWRHALRGDLLAARLAVEADEWDAADAQAAAVAAQGERYGAVRYVVLGTVVGALARARRGDPTDPANLQPTLDRLPLVAGGEAWWWLARLAGATGLDEWRRAAEAQLGALVRRAGSRRADLERFAASTLGS